MYYDEDTTTQENTDTPEDNLLILDGTVQLDDLDLEAKITEQKSVIDSLTDFFKAFNKS